MRVGLDVDDDDYETDKGIDYRFVETDEDGLLAPFGKGKAAQRRDRWPAPTANASNACWPI